MNPTGILLRKNDKHPNARMEGDSVIVDCRNCGISPDPGSRECVSCMVSAMCLVGGADRVILRTGRDIEVSGEAGRVLKDIASLKRWTIPSEPLPLRCKNCESSRSTVIGKAWESFPDPITGSVSLSYVENHPERDECYECVARTARALERLTHGVEEIKNSLNGGRTEI